MIINGLILAVIGIGVVFTFLLIMIGTLNLFSLLMKPLARLIPEPEEKIVTKVKKAAFENHEDIAVAIAAVHSFVN
ncbi:MAG: OadG family protein [Chitinispirillaceae bacterium]|nr:OadG family protein [Chitinispirillaceae bacterium]